jgi:hypothetical protein
VQQAIENSKTRKEGVEPSALEKLLQRDPNPLRAVVMALDMLMAGIDTVPKYIYLYEYDENFLNEILLC